MIEFCYIIDSFFALAPSISGIFKKFFQIMNLWAKIHKIGQDLTFWFRRPTQCNFLSTSVSSLSPKYVLVSHILSIYCYTMMFCAKPPSPPAQFVSSKCNETIETILERKFNIWTKWEANEIGPCRHWYWTLCRTFNKQSKCDFEVILGPKSRINIWLESSLHALSNHIQFVCFWICLRLEW